ncbi:hypothetical protein [Candidatus Marithrix sp. Canyon 246]|uniref:hypothetical protein n=1 Tax=Candidatus Marithrix sp. Canyon 246 TaxID=1827136 RepID=UPI00084A22FA|nr:hypothetical protein [Candidatus Marithrix sp. Canyon 246]
MSWGDAFKAAWNKATDVACDAAGALATGAKKATGWVKEKASDVADWSKQKYTEIKDKATKTANWVKKKTDEVKEWTKKKASQAETWVKDKAIKFSKMANKAYQNVKKKFGDIVAGATKIICKTANAIDNAIQKGLDRAAKERAKQKPKGDLLSQAFDVVKPSIKYEWSKPYPQKKGWGSYKDADDKPESGVKVGGTTEWAKHEDRLLYYGDESNNLQIGSYSSELKSGAAYDPKKQEFTADVIDMSAHVTITSWQTKNIKVDVGSLEGKGKIGITWGPDKKEAIAEANLSADLIKGKASGTLNITPKSIWDNTVGRLPWFGKAPKWLDHGISIGAEGEAGIGIGIGGKIGVKDSKFVLGGKLGFGPKLSFSLGIGFK